ncbi:MAG TPA: dihydroorotase [Chloroflexota bacterium]|nr:dihydroorotase [Chloroflexota bacterium]
MIRLTGGRVLDPSSGRDEVADVVIDDGRIVSEGAARKGEQNGQTVIDVSGFVVAPGFVDLHTHLREPGFEDAETIATGTRAAAAGGFTTVCAAGDTHPTMDTGSDVEALLRQARRDAVVRVLPVGTTTKRREGTELSEMADMADVGAVAFSDAGRAVRSATLMRHALEYSLLVERPIASHSQDADLVDGGVMHEGALATVLGLKGIPREAEEIAVARDLALARLTGGRLHLTHLSTAGAVDLVRRAKALGVRVSAEVTPHNLVLSDAAITERPYDTNARTDPPLRSQADALALLEGITDGTIDCIATDHSPRRWIDKACEFDQAAPGISGLETAFGLVMRLVHRGVLSLQDLIAALTYRPASAWGLPYGTLQVGAAADVVVLDPDQAWVVDPERFLSKGKNSPLGGQTLRGTVLLTIADGNIVYRNGL